MKQHPINRNTIYLSQAKVTTESKYIKIDLCSSSLFPVSLFVNLNFMNLNDNLVVLATGGPEEESQGGRRKE